MKTIVIDENYEGIKKEAYWWYLENNIIMPDAKIKIEIPLHCKKSIIGASLIANKWIEVVESLKVEESLIAREWLRVGESLIVNEWIEVEEWLEVGKSFEVGGWVKVFGTKTSKYANVIIDRYNVIFTSDYIKIGCKLFKAEEWENFTNDEIARMDEGALKWWKTWKDFILTTHKNLPEIY